MKEIESLSPALQLNDHRQDHYKYKKIRIHDFKHYLNSVKKLNNPLNLIFIV